VHAPLFHPVIAAKQFVTADHVGQGRFGLNVVVGWNEDEFAMFGVTQRDHEARYAYGQEWVDAVKMRGRTARISISTVSSSSSRRCARNPSRSADHDSFDERRCLTGRARVCAAKLRCLFHQCPGPTRPKRSRATWRGRERKPINMGRGIDVYTVGVVTCRPTKAEAEAYYRHCIFDNADWSAVDAILAKRKITAEAVGAEEFARRRAIRRTAWVDCHVGDPDHVAQELANLSRGGLTGIGISLVNYLDELPYFCAEVLPRLERLGLRHPARAFRRASGWPLAKQCPCRGDGWRSDRIAATHRRRPPQRRPARYKDGRDLNGAATFTRDLNQVLQQFGARHHAIGGVVVAHRAAAEDVDCGSRRCSEARVLLHEQHGETGFA